MFLEFIPLVGVKLLRKCWRLVICFSPLKSVCITLLKLFLILPVFLVSLFFPLIPKSLPSYVFAFHLDLMLTPPPPVWILSTSFLFCPFNYFFHFSLSFSPLPFILIVLLISQCRGLLFSLNSWLIVYFLSVQVGKWCLCSFVRHFLECYIENP